jgi:hypothetical protein
MEIKNQSPAFGATIKQTIYKNGIKEILPPVKISDEEAGLLKYVANKLAVENSGTTETEIDAFPKFAAQILGKNLPETDNKIKYILNGSAAVRYQDVKQINGKIQEGIHIALEV